MSERSAAAADDIAAAAAAESATAATDSPTAATDSPTAVAESSVEIALHDDHAERLIARVLSTQPPPGSLQSHPIVVSAERTLVNLASDSLRAEAVRFAIDVERAILWWQGVRGAPLGSAAVISGLRRRPHPWTAPVHVQRAAMHILRGSAPPRADVAVSLAATLSRPDGSSFKLWRLDPESRQPGGTAVLYLHGGGFFMGDLFSYEGVVGELSARCGCTVFFPEYGLAPECPLPTGLRDCQAAYAFLIETLRVPPQLLVVAGDSAGGNLTLGVLLQLPLSLPLPAAAVAISPIFDVSGSLPSHRANTADPVLTMVPCLTPLLKELAKSGEYSPLFAKSVERLPPLFIQYAEGERLADDSIMFAARVQREASSEVILDVAPKCPHVPPMFIHYIPEANEALDRIVAFIRARTTPTAVSASARDEATVSSPAAIAGAAAAAAAAAALPNGSTPKLAEHDVPSAILLESSAPSTPTSEPSLAASQ